MDVVQLPQAEGHFEEAVYFLPISSQKFQLLLLSTSERWKAEPPSGFEHRTHGLESSALTTRPLNAEIQKVYLSILLKNVDV